uniref:thymidine kinase n=1 Tax=viral metagenome TaxID=1070528 RepID=A0A6C0JH83_9ZZZZ
MNVPEDSGFIGMYIGPMYSGKTSKLRELYKQCTFCKIPVEVINYAEDIRYTDESMMSTHNKEMIPCIMAKQLFEAIPLDSNKMKTTKVFLINEGQFFPDVVEWVTRAAEPPYNKSIHICGLDGDFKRDTFGNWLDIIPHSNHIEKLKSICCDCKKNAAIFSHRITKEKEQKVIGNDNYIPLCRKCYHKKNKN